MIVSLTVALTACGGNAGSASAAPVSATPPATTPPTQGAAPPTITLTANPTTVTAGQFTNLQWVSTGATTVTITPTLPGAATQPLDLTGNAAVAPAATTTYTATATSAAGVPATASVLVTVLPPGTVVAPKLTCSASPSSIIAGQTSTLTCSLQNATSLSIDNGVGAVAVPPGTAIVKPTVTTTYTASAVGADGTPLTQTITVTVAAAAQLAVTLNATPDLIAPGQTSTLAWQSQSATSVTIQPVIPGCAAAPCPVALNGSVVISPTQTTTYTATARDAAGNIVTALKNVNVTVNNASLQNIKHIIYFLQENHSFDNYFGQLGPYKVSRGFANDVAGLPANAVQFDAAKVAVHPYHLQTTCIETISPSWNPSWGAFDLNGYTLQPGPGVGGNILVGGTPAMDGFVNDRDLPTTLDPQYHRVMGYYDQTDIPYYYEAATQFATSDSWFSPLMAGTVANRLYAFTASSFGHAHDDPPPLGGFTQPMIFDLLNQHGVSWRYYLQDPANLLGEFSEWGDQILINSHVFPIDNWFTTLASPTADTDLPSVVFIEHAGNTSLDEHPGNNIQTGAAQAAAIINALMASPAWQSSVFILSYDEFGGWYDHVPPFVEAAPDNIAPIENPLLIPLLPGDFVHSGFRLPLIVFSPWVKPHFVSHKPRDTTSILKLIETRFGLPALTGRDAAADDMTEFFDFTAPFWLTPPLLPTQPTNGVCDVTKELLGQN